MDTSASPLAAVLEGKRVVICAGAGGVGKTTTSAAIAVELAARGARVAVVTIDPARRLAGALGLEAMGNEPRRVAPERLAAHGVALEGELWALMLDAKRTWDELIERLAPDAATREEIFANPIYRSLSGAVAGSQEFSAIAKLDALEREGGFDVLVLDTPPARNAQDFLDAPGRLNGFFEGRAIRLFLRPAGFGGRLLGRGTGIVFGLLERATGVDLLRDLSGFFGALSGLLGGITEQAGRVERLLGAPDTTFVVVTSPEPEPSNEAIRFHRHLRAAGLPFGGLVVNRVQADPGGALPGGLDPGLEQRLARTVRELSALAARDRTALERLDLELGSPPTVVVAELEGEVSDLGGLDRLRAQLFT